MSWITELPGGEQPAYIRLAEAIGRAIAQGALKPGERLPPHRDLAHSLGLGVGTVSKAYAEASARGLIYGHVGRGSFVNAPLSGPAEESGPIDLARNLPPPRPAERPLLEALGKLRGSPDLLQAMSYAGAEGLARPRSAAVAWLGAEHRIAGASADVIVQTNGGQHGIALALSALCRPGDTVLCEASSFFGIRMLAENVPYSLRGVAIDAEGLIPDALEQAIRETQARLIYTIPTLHNPTGRTTTADRRRRIAEIARRHAVSIIEDDTYRGYAPDQGLPPAFVELLPERTVYVASLSKALSPGLRLGFLLVPNREIRSAIIRTARATAYCPPAINAMIFAHWVEEGLAQAILAEHRREMEARVGLAIGILGSSLEAPASPFSPHVWMPMDALEAERIASRALRAGVKVTPPDLPILSLASGSGLRLCIGSPADRSRVEAALAILRAVISDGLPEQTDVIV